MGPHNGARVVARAWVDPDFKARLLADGTAAIAELGIAGPEGNVRVVENTPEVHNLVVCTLCSCYPWPLLGLPPIWYKSFAYRARAVAEPRAVLREFGLELDAGRRGAGVGLERRGALPRAARATRRHRGPQRGGARRAGDPRTHGRHRGARARPESRVAEAVAGPVERVGWQAEEPARSSSQSARRPQSGGSSALLVVVEERVRQQHGELLGALAVEHPEHPRASARRRPRWRCSSACAHRRRLATRGSTGCAGRRPVLADAQVDVPGARSRSSGSRRASTGVGRCGGRSSYTAPLMSGPKRMCSHHCSKTRVSRSSSTGSLTASGNTSRSS